MALKNGLVEVYKGNFGIKRILDGDGKGDYYDLSLCYVREEGVILVRRQIMANGSMPPGNEFLVLYGGQERHPWYVCLAIKQGEKRDCPRDEVKRLIRKFQRFSDLEKEAQQAFDNL